MIKIPGSIPILISPFFWLLAALIGWMSTNTIQGTAVWIILILVSVLVHEYGHALTAIAFGQKTHIELMGFGGLTKRRGPKLKPWQDFIVILNGPLAGFVLCGAAWWGYSVLRVGHPNALLTQTFAVAYYVNIFWTVVNLLPIQPLDGGKLLGILLEGIFGLKGTKIALFISLLLAGAMSLFFFIAQMFIAGALFLMFTYESYKVWRASLSISEQDQNSVLQHLLKEAERDLHAANKEDALAKLQRIRELARIGVIYVAATEHMAEIYADRGEFQTAYELLEPVKSKLSSEGVLLFHRLAYNLEHWQEAISLGDKAYQIKPMFESALVNASCHAMIGQVRPAIGWLQCAVREGMPDPQHVLKHHRFDKIRQDPLFRDFQESLSTPPYK